MLYFMTAKLKYSFSKFARYLWWQMHFHIWAVIIGLVHMIGHGLAAAEYSAFLIVEPAA